MDKKHAVNRFKLVIIVLNCLLASLSLINLYTIASGAVQVDIPEETDFAWTIDTKYQEVNYLANFTVSNHGLYDITDLDIHAIVKTEKGTMLIDYTQNDLRIPAGHTRRFNIGAVLPFERIDTKEWRELMLNDSVFYLDVDIKANYLWGLSTFVVDDILEYEWQAPIKKIENSTEAYIVSLFKFMASEDASINGFMDMVVEKFGNNAMFGQIDWSDSTLRLESWPLGDNTSRMIVKVSLDLFGGRRTVTFELVMLLKMEDDGYDITLEEFSFNYH